MEASFPREEGENGLKTQKELFAATSSKIESLNAEYAKLNKAESYLMDELKKLQEEHTALQSALRQTTETGRDKMAREKKERDEIAMKNLQEALLGSDEGSSCDDDDENTAPVPIGGSISHMNILDDFSQI
eukprot:183730_1